MERTYGTGDAEGGDALGGVLGVDVEVVKRTGVARTLLVER